MTVVLFSFNDFMNQYFSIRIEGLFHMSRGVTFWCLVALFATASYFIGSLNFAILISKYKYHDDIRKHGSHNAGFTNMKRVYGNTAGYMAFAGDLLKSIVCVLATMLILGQDAAYIAGLFCILGHCFPVYYQFKGGKGVATTAAMLLVLEPVVFLICMCIFVLVVLATKYISMGSIIGSLIYPLILNRYYNMAICPITGEEYISFILTITSLLTALLIFFMHRSNIRRIWAGEENKFSFKDNAKSPAANKTKAAAPRSLHNIDNNSDNYDNDDNNNNNDNSNK